MNHQARSFIRRPRFYCVRSAYHVVLLAFRFLYHLLSFNKDLLETFRQADILLFHCIFKERSDVLRIETGDAAAYRSDEESLMRMLPGLFCEFVCVRAYRLHASLHLGYGMALSLRPVAVARHCAKAMADGARSSAVHSCEVAADYEYLAGGES